MRIFHTSDWHLGQTLHGQDRDFEHAHFLDWLLEQLKERRPDALLIAGDIFDTINPPVKAQERLYDFIVQAHLALPLLTLVMIAGNHDSGARIELPAPLMRSLRAHALGRVLWLDDGSLDAERLLVPLNDATGDIRAWCLALPFLRPAEVTGGRDDSYAEGIARVHAELIACAERRRQPGQALIAMSHAHLAGGQVSEDSERNIIVGNAEAQPASQFSSSIAYVALGHLHKPQKVAKQEHIRYSGSPLPLSFAEVDYPHQILDVRFEGEQLAHIDTIRVPRIVDMVRLGPASLGDILEAIERQPDMDLFSTPENHRAPWLEVRVVLEAPQPDLRQRLETALEGKALRLVRIGVHYAGQPSSTQDSSSLVALEQLSPQDLFTRAWQDTYGQAPEIDVLDDFAQLLEDVTLGEQV
ncbi:exodeoxyribonuclease I subunit D [Pseudomonas duriflava]|uniref:Nuclease SbcCD subunit D n=1 Tax=Pseudomonas duriflava TaxID=459528 RepID=A0A562QAS5_9PSED|nr:exonuclease SbcCD subunit D C-terminal domain-containing protein [Pseudomonas duriflava]TWI53875.1 exodeoxyribonuclease I subunit D [Pseudomonas duriflava]